MLKDNILDYLQIHRLLDNARKPHFLVAYSGGRDSTALLHALHQIKNDSQGTFTITAAFYAHPWRGLQYDIAAIHKNCHALNIPWIVLTPNFALPHTEADAREDRYHQLAQLAQDLNVSAIFTAHHQDDQIETILFRLLRGTGLDGLAGIPEIRLIHASGQNNRTTPLMRPLLNVPRSHIDQYMAEFHLTYADDPSNQDIKYKRNFIRKKLIPMIEEGFPQVRQSLLTLAEVSVNERSIIDSKMDEIWEDLFDPSSNSLNAVRFNLLSVPFQRHLIRRFLKHNQQSAGHQRIDDILAFLSGKQQKRLEPGLFSIGSHAFIYLYRHQIRFENNTKRVILPLETLFPCQLSHLGLKLTIKIIELTTEEKLKPIDLFHLPPHEVYVNLNKFQGKTLSLRSRQKGDKIQPLGMSQPIKLKRLLINRNIPRFEREVIPVLADGANVLWVVGVSLSEEIKVKDKPTHKITVQQYPQSDP